MFFVEIEVGVGLDISVRKEDKGLCGNLRIVMFKSVFIM